MTTRETILVAAEARIRRDGFHACSFRDLADDVGVKSASVHYYFPTKSDLGVDLMGRYQQQMLSAFGDARDERPLDKKLEAVWDAYRRRLEPGQGACLCGVLSAEYAGLPDPVGQVVKDYLLACQAWLAAAFDCAGAVEPDKQALEIAMTVQGALLVANAMEDRSLFDEALGLTLRRQNIG